VADRRDLAFKDWDQVRADLDLLSGGYEQAGNWNLAQVCLHLNDWMRFPMDGFPRASFPMNLVIPLVRISVGKSQLQKIISTGRMPAGGPTLPATVHADATSEGDPSAVADLRETISRFESFTGDIHPSPIFGPMDKATAEKLQLVHFVHHLSFLIPKNLQPAAS
jgi:hypothetical protein